MAPLGSVDIQATSLASDASDGDASDDFGGGTFPMEFLSGKIAAFRGIAQRGKRGAGLFALVGLTGPRPRLCRLFSKASARAVSTARPPHALGPSGFKHDGPWPRNEKTYGPQCLRALKLRPVFVGRPRFNSHRTHTTRKA